MVKIRWWRWWGNTFYRSTTVGWVVFISRLITPCSEKWKQTPDNDNVFSNWWSHP